MQTRTVLLLPLVVAMSVACGDASLPEPQPPPRHAKALRAEPDLERQRIASRYLVRPSTGATLATFTEMATALDLPAGSLVSGQLTTPAAEAAVVLPNFGDILPRKGNSLVVLSTGYVNDRVRVPEPGTDFAPPGTAGDVVTLRLTFNVRPGMTRLSFDYRFLSAESPDFIGSLYNDQFTAQVTEGQGLPRLIEQTSVNSAHFFDASKTRAGNTQFDSLLADDPSGVDYFPVTYPHGTQVYPDAGITDFKTVNVAISGGGQVTLVFEIRDLEDGILDSTVVIDNIAFSSLEVIDPNPILIDTHHETVETNLPRLAALGTAASSVAADGATIVLLRARLPGPGSMVFKLGDTQIPANGGLGAVGSTAAPTNIVTVPVQQISTGQYYAFALYTAPEDFNRPGLPAPGDTKSSQRTVGLATTYTPVSGASFADTHELIVVRPPVVAIHDIWSNCEFWEWNAGISREDYLDVTCADYSATNSESIDSPANRNVFANTVREALLEMRLKGTAVTRVDTLAHGMGGVMVRRYARWTNYKNALNFGKGDLNRIIYLNTPHGGSRMANAMVDLRNNMKLVFPNEWQTVVNDLEKNFQISIGAADAGADAGPLAIDDLQLNNPILVADAGPTVIPSHVLVTRNAMNIERPQARGLVFDKLKVLYDKMEKYHPLTDDLLPPAYWNLIMRANIERLPASNVQPSRLFCNQDFDLFASEMDQRGGASDAGTTTFQMSATALDLEHFKAPSNAAVTTRIIQLLNSPINGGSFDPSLPAPSAPPLCTGGGGGSVALLSDEGPDPEWFEPSQAQTRPDEPPAPRGPSVLAGGIRIVSPAPGTPVSPGGTVNVVLEGTGGFVPMVAYVMGAGKAVIIEQAPFTTSFQIPAHAIGSLSLAVTAISAQRQMVSAEAVVLPIVSSAQLTSMSVTNGDGVIHGPGSTRHLGVTGLYSDGVQRNITAQALGTLYSSSNDGIATVTTAGVVTGRAPGIATIVVRNADVTTSISVTVLEAPVANCLQVRLNDYNLFVLEDYKQGIDVGGRIAAGGSIFLKDFRVGWKLPDTDTDNILVAGINLNLNNGTVWGDARYGGQLIPQGTLSIQRGSASRGTPVDFAARGAALRTLSTRLAALPVQGTTTVESWGGILLRGTHPKVNVFWVEAESFTNATLLSVEAPVNSLAIINVRGTSARFSNFGHVFSGGIDESGILFNFPQATSLTAFDYGFYGTVLAPNAHVSFNAGSWVGGMYARSLAGNAVGHINRLRDTDICQ
ncbi:choice-of-anchor A family protein [Myxococcus sp. AM011]|uniref:choice-of-anchor A family protein n=1 Tax=Myxococcus sp. AM011 TaxID=2745200 RepID=UPI001C3D1AD1|nr:choice-of-anchor A family protein [Myxococcus sp. AM011]